MAGKTPEAHIVAFVCRLLSAGDILSAINRYLDGKRCRSTAFTVLSRSLGAKRARSTDDKWGINLRIRYRIEP